VGTVANSPGSFRAALALPVDLLEADVRFTAGGVPYLAHDAPPADAQDGAMRLAELLRLAAAHPTVRLNLDLKEHTGVRQLASLVTQSGMSSRVLLTGVTADVVRRVRDDADGLPYLLNAAPAPWQRWTSRGALRGRSAGTAPSGSTPATTCSRRCSPAGCTRRGCSSPCGRWTASARCAA
jgi:hypothetical protein